MSNKEYNNAIKTQQQNTNTKQKTKNTFFVIIAFCNIYSYSKE